MYEKNYEGCAKLSSFLKVLNTTLQRSQDDLVSNVQLLVVTRVTSLQGKAGEEFIKKICKLIK